ncbi:MAG: phospholipid/cholesterol/gamma-HCH transport system substrate-binding protein, partial [Solirubrobacteraceae bacterium]|nr:phospholipid/cholesterol/gamma-HCH transport system substrate-binding protein [Solirubrobacteraceae bacterium]
MSNRPTRKTRSVRTSLTIAAACCALALGMLVLGATAQRGLPGSSHYNLNADFADAANLTRYAEVRIAGRRVGQVIAIDRVDGATRVRLQLGGDVGPLPATTTARIRLKGLLGAKFVELRPEGAGAPVPDGGTLPVANTSASVELFDLFAALDKKRRLRLGETITGLGKGFLGRGQDLNDALGEFPQATTDLHDVAATINGRTGAAQRFVPGLDAAAAAFDPARQELAAGFDPQATALEPFIARRAAVQDTLTVAPSALDALRTGLHQTDPLLRETERLAGSLVRLTGPAPAALRDTTALLRESDRPLRATGTLLRDLQGAVDPTLQLTGRLDALITPLRHTFLDGLPLLDELHRRRCDYLGFARNWRSMLGYGVPGTNPIGPQNGLRVT